MDLLDIAKYAGGGIVVILLGFIKIPKIELNIWNWLGRTIGRSLTGELRDLIKELKTDLHDNIELLQKDIDDVEKKLDDHVFYDELYSVKSVRLRIIRFNDEILDNKKHTSESYDCILEDVDTYEKYCNSHPDFSNNKAVMAIHNIKANYEECMKKKEFK